MKMKLINNPPCASPLITLYSFGGCVSNCMFFFIIVLQFERKTGGNTYFIMEINIYILIPVNSSTVIPLVCIPSNVEWYSTPIGCWHLSYNTKDLCRRLSFDNSFLDQPVHQTCVYVAFGNPSADMVLPFLSRL